MKAITRPLSVYKFHREYRLKYKALQKRLNIDEFRANQQAYRENLAFLIESVGKPDHDFYVRRERELAMKDRLIGYALGIYSNGGKKND